MPPFRLARPRFLVYFAGELALVVAVVFGLARLTAAWSSGPASPLWVPVSIVSALFCGVLFSTQWVNLGEDGGLLREMIVFSMISLIAGLVSFSVVWGLLGEDHRFWALLALEGGIAVPLVVALWRWLSIRLRFLDAIRERILILGTGETAKQVCRGIVADHASEYAVVGFADRDEERSGTILAMGVRIQTGYDSLSSFCPGRVDRVIVALDEKRGHLPVRRLMEIRLQGIEIEEATSLIERVSGKIAVETMLPSWLIFSEGFRSTRLRVLLKRAADLVLATALFAVSWPLMLVTAVLIKLESRGPALYRQDRLGRADLSFDLLKFRSMHVGAELDTGPVWAKKNDTRVTRVGRIIRKLRIDELPQLLNVLRGEMSFVGPRPEREHFVRQLEQSIPYYGLRAAVRPGITGWSQVQYGYGGTEEAALEKLKYDLYYIKNSNLLLDFWIVLKTFRVVLFGKGSQ